MAFEKEKKDVKTFLKEEPWYYYIGFGIAIILVLMMYLFALTGWTFYGQNVHQAQNYWLVIGLIIQAAGVFIVYKGNKSRHGIQTGHIIALFVALALGFIAFAGFNFDIA